MAVRDGIDARGALLAQQAADAAFAAAETARTRFVLARAVGAL